MLRPGRQRSGKITPTGSPSLSFRFPPPTFANLSEPAGITAGQDGNIWFTDILANNIGRVDSGPRIGSISPNTGWTPLALQPGTGVVLKGSGFTQGMSVQFGNAYARAVPESISSNGTVIHVRVPRLATVGPLALITPDGQTAAISATAFTVHSDRNTNGFSFHNFEDPGVSFSDVVSLFGRDQTYINVRIFGIKIKTNIHNPFAVLFKNIVDPLVDDGQCFGMSLASGRLLLRQKPFRRSRSSLGRRSRLCGTWRHQTH